LYFAANTNVRAHLLRAFSSTCFRELVQAMSAANGSIVFRKVGFLGATLSLHGQWLDFLFAIPSPNQKPVLGS
jgi:hypothetical protein